MSVSLCHGNFHDTLHTMEDYLVFSRLKYVLSLSILHLTYYSNIETSNSAVFVWDSFTSYLKERERQGTALGWIRLYSNQSTSRQCCNSTLRFPIINAYIEFWSNIFFTFFLFRLYEDELPAKFCFIFNFFLPVQFNK